MSFTKDKDSDNYITNKEQWFRIKDFIPKDKKIWSPFYCDGSQKEYFKEMGFDIIHQDEDFFNDDLLESEYQPDQTMSDYSPEDLAMSSAIEGFQPMKYSFLGK